MPRHYELIRDEEVFAQPLIPADKGNGAGPLWCHGSTVVTRAGGRLWMTSRPIDTAIAPLSNAHWAMHVRDEVGWREVYRETHHVTREPSPIASTGDAVLVSANESLAPLGAYSGPARPRVYRFDVNDPERPPVAEDPVWADTADFTEHSYRAFASSNDTGRAVIMNIQHHRATQISLREADGSWHGLGALDFPWGDTYPTPEPVRLCYANVFLRGKGAHYFGVSDIIEPYPQWREAKFQITQQKWDYEFRRLFYTWTPDLGREAFRPWIEVASRDATAGHTQHLGLHVDGDGVAHMLWSETSLDVRLRDAFFPGEPYTSSLHYATMRDGEERSRTTLAISDHDRDEPCARVARFHIAADGSISVVAEFRGLDLTQPTQLRTMDLSDIAAGWQTVTTFGAAMNMFLESTPRAGSEPSDMFDAAYVKTTDTHETMRVFTLARQP